MTRRFVTAALASAQRLSGPSQPSRGVASLCVAVAFAVDHPRGQRVCPGDDASGPGTTVALSAAELAPRRRQKLRAPSRAETQAASGKPEGALRTRLAAWGHVDVTPTAWPSQGRGAASCRLVLGDDAPVAGPLAPAAHTPGAATCRSVARRRRPRLPEAERGPRAPEEQPGAPGRPAWRTSLAAGRSCPVPGASAASSPPLGYGQASGRLLGLNQTSAPAGPGAGCGSAPGSLPPRHAEIPHRVLAPTAAWRDAVWRAWLSPATSAHVFQTLTRGRSHAAFLTENKSYPILRPKGKQDSRRHAAPESRGHFEREASGTAVSPATTTCGTRGAEGGHGGPAGRGHCS